MQTGLVEKIVSFFRFESDDGGADEMADYSEAGDKVVQMGRKAKHKLEISLINPTSFDEAKRVANSLKSGSAVVLNLSKLDSEIGKRLVDFVSGNVYALGGATRKVGENIFVFTPAGVSLEFDEGQESGNPDSGYFFREK